MSDETQMVRQETMPTRDPFAMITALETLGESSFVRSLVETGYYTERGDSKEQTLHKVVTKIAWGAELGMTPMAALKNVIVIKGNPTLSAAAVGDLVMRSGVVTYRVMESTAKICRMEWTRNGVVQGVNQWTIDDAKRAGLTGDNWRKYPVDMLRSRCITQGARTYCPDVFGGPIYTPEELRSTVVEVRQTDRQQPTQQPREDKRDVAKASLIATVHGATDNAEQRTRIWQAIGAKVGKGSGDMTAEDFTECAGIIRAYIDEGVLDQWVDTQIGADEVQDAEVVNEVVGDEGAWMKANKWLHVAWATFAKASNIKIDGVEYAIVHDVVREQSGMDAKSSWQDVETEAMRKMARLLEHDGGSLARVGIADEWLKQATERGAI